ncbi:Flp pilus assembly complex ATPase component TadA [Candidatus Woesearchaeota archaeon]|nr:Flp pilus assembly complex ATPase component TadA [Candidatus Woesearchaeota archaeon]
MGLFSSLKKDSSKNEEQKPIQPALPVPQQDSKQQVKEENTTNNINKDAKLFFKIEQPTIPSLPEAKDQRTIDVKYPLIPPYAFARIRWDQKETELVYEIEEPQLTDKEEKILETLEEGIKELINLSFISVSDKNTILVYLEKNIRVLLTELSIELSTESFVKIMYYIYRDFVGLNELEPLMNDYFVEDIECNGINTPIYIVHRKYRNIRTNLVYKDIHKLAAFVEKLAQKCGRYISYAEPLLDGSLPGGDRVQATYSTDVTTRGPTMSIRRFTKEPWSPIQLMIKGTCSAEIYAYLWMAVEYENSMMVIGGTGSGKTSFINTLAFFIPPQARVVSIEDTRELQLEHENWLPSVARAGVGLTNLVGQRYGEVSLFDLLRASFRQRPDYIIVGEVRGKEAFVLFQAFASVRGDEEILIIKENRPLRIKIKNLENEDITKLKAITYNIKEKKCEILPIKSWIKHPKRNILYKIKTRTGREITITADHSVFTFENQEIKEIKGEELVIGSNIIIPANIPCGYNNIEKINLLEWLPNLRIYAPELIKEALHKLGYYQSNVIVNCKSITDYCSQGIVSKPNALKAEKFFKLMKEACIGYNIDKLEIKYDGMSEKREPFLEIDDYLLKLLGYYLSEGSLNTSRRCYRIELYNGNEEVLKNMEECIVKLVNRKPSRRIIDGGYGEAIELSFNNKIIYEFIKKYCKTKLEKLIPDFIFGLDKKRIGIFLSALYCGDGNLRDKGISYYTTSKSLANGVAQLLLVYGIVASISKRNRDGRKTTDYEINFYANYKKEELLKYVKPIGKTCNITKGIVDKNLLGDLYCDKVRSIEVLHLDKPEYVYDISIPYNQNFIGGFGLVLLHNSGHPGMATMHAEDVGTLIKRLETEPINLSGSLIETLSAVVVMSQSKIKGKEVRKVASVDEVVEVKEGLGGEVTNNVFKWNPKTDTFLFNPNSKVFEKISMHYGFTKEQVLNEFKIRTRLIKELYRRGIIGFKQVQAVIHEYYKSPEIVLKRFGII